jgi:glycosidase
MKRPHPTSNLARACKLARLTRACAAAVLATLLLATSALPTTADAADAKQAVEYSHLSARLSPIWLQEGVIYQIFPRVFSDRGDLNGVIEQLDRLQALGVNILYLMPIHPQGKLKAKGFRGSPYAVRDYYGYERNALRMRFTDDQDESRAIAQFGLPASLAASAIMFTMDGVPLLYNGMEVGDTAESGAPALFERIPILWSIAERRPEVPVFYRQMIALRRAHPALTHGDVRWLRNADEQRIVTFARAAAGERLVIAVNLSSQPFAGVIEADSGDYEDITPYWQAESAASDACPRRGCSAALPAVSLQPWGFRIFRRVARAH